MLGGVQFERCPTRFLGAETEQLVALAREGALTADPIHGATKLHEALAFVAAYDAANVRKADG